MMRTALVTALVFLAGICPAFAGPTYFYTQGTYSIGVSPASVTAFYSSAYKLIGYDPSTGSGPSLLTLYDGGASFSLVSLQATADTVPSDVYLKDPSGTVLQTITFPLGGYPWQSPSIPVGSGQFSQLTLTADPSGTYAGNSFFFLSNIVVESGGVQTTLVPGPAPVPEPASLILLGTAVCCLGMLSHRKRTRTARLPRGSRS